MDRSSNSFMKDVLQLTSYQFIFSALIGVVVFLVKLWIQRGSYGIIVMGLLIGLQFYFANKIKQQSKKISGSHMVFLAIIPAAIFSIISVITIFVGHQYLRFDSAWLDGQSLLKVILLFSATVLGGTFLTNLVGVYLLNQKLND